MIIILQRLDKYPPYRHRIHATKSIMLNTSILIKLESTNIALQSLLHLHLKIYPSHEI